MNSTTWTTYREYLDKVGEPNAAAALTLADAMQTQRDATPRSVGPQPDTLTVDGFARWMQVSTRKVYEMIRQGELPNLRAGRSIRIPIAEALASLEGKKKPERGVRLTKDHFASPTS